MSEVCVRTDHVAYASSNYRTKITLIETELGVDAPHVYMGARALCCFHNHNY